MSWYVLSHSSKRLQHNLESAHRCITVYTKYSFRKYGIFKNIFGHMVSQLDRLVICMRALLRSLSSALLKDDQLWRYLSSQYCLNILSVVCFGALWDSFWSEPKKLTLVFYYLLLKKLKWKPQNFYLGSNFLLKTF